MVSAHFLGAGVGALPTFRLKEASGAGAGLGAGSASLKEGNLIGPSCRSQGTFRGLQSCFWQRGPCQACQQEKAMLKFRREGALASFPKTCFSSGISVSRENAGARVSPPGLWTQARGRPHPGSPE